MKALKIIFSIVAAVIVILLIATAFLPSKVNFKRSVEISASAAEIYPHVDCLKRWDDWSPWKEVDPAANFSFEGPDCGKGAIMKWSGSNKGMGRGSLKIVESEPPNKIKYEFYIYDSKFGEGEFTFKEKGGRTKVEWSFKADLDFFARWAGLGMESMMGDDFEKGLKNLKKILEKPTQLKFKMSIQTTPPFAAYGIRNAVDLSDSLAVRNAFESSYKKLANFIEKKGLKIVGAPIAITNSYEKGKWDFYAAFPINAKNIKDEGIFKAIFFPGGLTVKCSTFGPYEQSYVAYNAIEKFIKDNKLKITGNSWEEYITDPNKTPSEKARMNIYFPVEKPQ